jgi:hypothetical protein
MTSLAAVARRLEITRFDYGVILPANAEIARSAVLEIRSSRQRQIDEVIVTGRALLRVKDVLEHGEFGRWLTSEFGWAERTAQNYMKAAASFGENPQRVAHLPLRITYALAAQPPTTREHILERVDTGELLGEQNIFDSIKSAITERKADESERKRRVARKNKSPEQIEKECRRAKREEAIKAKFELEHQARQTAAREAANLILEHMPDQIGALVDLIDRSDVWGFVFALRARR